MVKRYYILATNDKYELPLTVPMSATELAALIGYKRSTVVSEGTDAYMARRRNRLRGVKKWRIVGFNCDFSVEETE